MRDCSLFRRLLLPESTVQQHSTTKYSIPYTRVFMEHSHLLTVKYFHLKYIQFGLQFLLAALVSEFSTTYNVYLLLYITNARVMPSCREPSSLFRQQVGTQNFFESQHILWSQFINLQKYVYNPTFISIFPSPKCIEHFMRQK